MSHKYFKLLVINFCVIGWVCMIPGDPWVTEEMFEVPEMERKSSRKNLMNISKTLFGDKCRNNFECIDRLRLDFESLLKELSMPDENPFRPSFLKKSKYETYHSRIRELCENRLHFLEQGQELLRLFCFVRYLAPFEITFANRKEGLEHSMVVRLFEGMQSGKETFSVTNYFVKNVVNEENLNVSKRLGEIWHRVRRLTLLFSEPESGVENSFDKIKKLEMSNPEFRHFSELGKVQQESSTSDQISWEQITNEVSNASKLTNDTKRSLEYQLFEEFSLLHPIVSSTDPQSQSLFVGGTGKGLKTDRTFELTLEDNNMFELCLRSTQNIFRKTKTPKPRLTSFMKGFQLIEVVAMLFPAESPSPIINDLSVFQTSTRGSLTFIYDSNYSTSNFKLSEVLSFEQSIKTDNPRLLLLFSAFSSLTYMLFDFIFYKHLINSVLILFRYNISILFVDYPRTKNLIRQDDEHLMKTVSEMKKSFFDSITTKDPAVLFQLEMNPENLSKREDFITWASEAHYKIDPSDVNRITDEIKHYSFLYGIKSQKHLNIKRLLYVFMRVFSDIHPRDIKVLLEYSIHSNIEHFDKSREITSEDSTHQFFSILSFFNELKESVLKRDIASMVKILSIIVTTLSYQL